MRNYAWAVALIALTGCQKKESDKPAAPERPKDQKEFQMYEMSEMSLLMEQMFADNQRLRAEIIAGNQDLGEMPEHFTKIYSAKMTDPEENDDFFKTKASEFISAQAIIYNDPKMGKMFFNKAVDACIACHQSKCGGPIPRIKKLYIK